MNHPLPVRLSPPGSIRTPLTTGGLVAWEKMQAALRGPLPDDAHWSKCWRPSLRQWAIISRLAIGSHDVDLNRPDVVVCAQHHGARRRCTCRKGPSGAGVWTAVNLPRGEKAASKTSLRTGGFGRRGVNLGAGAGASLRWARCGGFRAAMPASRRPGRAVSGFTTRTSVERVAIRQGVLAAPKCI